MPRFAVRCLFLVLAATVFPPLLQAQTRLLRFPDVQGERVAFCHAGDIWTAPDKGGTATRLTAHPGYELFPRFSPDGRWIAFTGQYDGDEQVYVIAAEGGVPRQLTFYPARGPLPPRWGYDNQVYDWSADGKSILFRSMRYGSDLSDSSLFLVPLSGGLPEPLPMPESGAGDLSPDGTQVVYSPLVRDFRTWKRYQGGWAQELYIFDLKSHAMERVTDHPRADRDPMWIGDTIYFSSDRDGTLNLYGYEVGTQTTRQLTTSSRWDVRWPSDDGVGRIVYELDGQLHIHDLTSGQSRALSIFVPDDGVARRPSRVDASAAVEDYSLSPKGERALFVARGDVFSAPIEKGPTRNLTHSSGAHDKWARWSPDGRRVAFVSDATGEEEIYVVSQDGTGKPEQLTHGGKVMRYAAEWSPSGRHLAFGDKDGRLHVLDVESRELRQVADDDSGQIRDYAWSPDGGFLAFSMGDPSGFSSLYVWEEEASRLRRITPETFNEFGPAWDPAGDFLYYLSDREFAPQIGSFEWNYAGDRETGIFALALRPEVKHPFWPDSDEVTLDGEGEAEEKEGEEKGGGKDKGKEKAIEPITIDFDGLASRVVRVPVEADNYSGLSALKGHLLFVQGTPFYYGRSSGGTTDLKIFSMEDREASTLAEDIRGYALSGDGSKVMVRQGGDFKRYEVKPKAKDPEKVSTAGLKVDRVPAEEWAQIFDEVWRRFRDFFYVENMHGYDWEALRQQYRPLLEHVAHRSDLNYVIGEMIAELSVGHAYISGGDYEVPQRPTVALPGAEFALDAGSGRYRIARILKGQNEEDRYRAPLTELGVNVQEGEYVLAIDGENLGAADNPYRMLQHRADRPVSLTVNSRPSLEGARQEIFNPVTSEASLRYYNKVDDSRRRVEEMTDGRLGYLHLPDMGANGIREFIKWFYGQVRKEGLIIDVRGNGGGNVSQMVIERLRRQLLGTRFSRNSALPGTYPGTVFYGHMACLLDEDSASDGDIFPHMFRQAGLGPLIGKRSWGGVVGITNHGTLLDGGTVFVPEFGTNAVDGSWIIEGHGVDPDIEVENDPAAVLDGRDPQLERAVAEVLARLKADPRRLPQRPADPVKTR